MSILLDGDAVTSLMQRYAPHYSTTPMTIGWDWKMSWKATVLNRASVPTKFGLPFVKFFWLHG
jgi:hypothetical protein